MYRHALLSWLLLVTTISLGCGAQAPTVDDTPFRAAIAEYLRANNMAMKIKEMKQAPVIKGDRANLTASMTHEQLGGPSVMWNFQFARQPDNSWQVIGHHD